MPFCSRRALSWLCHALCLFAAIVPAFSDAGVKRFYIEDDTFMKDGEPIVIRSGSLHYFRVPPIYWRDRIQRMKALGLNTITAYVAWNFHEEVEGEFHDLEMVGNFLDTAHEEGMMVIFRPGPYICGEWEFGGFPSYLLAKPGLKLRTYNEPYLNAMDRWFKVLFPSVSSKTWSKGGPIIAVQIENEYGSFGDVVHNPDDAQYMLHVYEVTRSYFGSDVLYTTIDGGEDGDKTKLVLERGSPWKNNASVFATVDGSFNSNHQYSKKFAKQKEFNAPGYSPKMWCELWVGWFTVWADDSQANYSAYKSNGVEHRSVKDGVQGIVDQGASFSIYMAHGGTNFGYWSGGNGDQTTNGWASIQPDITSYDYSAPISEAGDHNIGSDGGDLFAALREAISSKYGKPAADEPAPIPKEAYGEIVLNESAELLVDKLQSCSHTVGHNERFPTFEDLGHAYGFMLYRRTPDSDFAKQTLKFDSFSVHDRVQVFVDKSPAGIAYRREGNHPIPIPGGKSMDLLVENMGRVNYGEGMYDHKGLLMKPPVEGTWTAYCLPLKGASVQGLDFIVDHNWTSGQPVFRRGALNVSGTPRDTFLDSGGLTKGLIWVNGHNLGRYWATQGPQCTLYVPASYLSSGDNEVIVLDLEGSTAKAIMSVAAPRWGACSATKVASRETIVVIAAAIMIVVLIAGCIGCIWYCKKKKSSARIALRDDGAPSEFSEGLLDQKPI